jgi:dolichyl-phosphate-mannose-protein mannosyltransferase
MMRTDMPEITVARGVWLFGVALGVRLACWLFFVSSGVRPLADERGYFAMAGGWAEVLQSLMHLSRPTRSMVGTALGSVFWPPLHPFVLGVARALPVDDLAAARLVGVIAGAVTTVVVVLLTARLAGREAANAAALIHALYPSFVFFSVTLWSETLFILLLLALLFLVVRAIDSGSEVPSGRIFVLGCGTALLLLTREAALAIVVGLLVWLAVRLPRGRRLRTVGGVALVAVLLVMPWSAAASWFVGRPIFLTAAGMYNLALGNNPWTPPSLGTGEAVPKLRYRLLEATREGRAGEIVRGEIFGHPLRSAQRAIVRAGQVAALDFFPLRHLATVTVPALPAWSLPVGLFLQWLSLAALLFLAGVGICGPDAVRHRSLLLTLVAAGMAGPLATVAHPRYALPLLGVLLPAAGCGWTKLRRGSPALHPAVFVTLAVGSLLLPVAMVRQVVETRLSPSSHYSPALEPVARIVGAAPLYADLLACWPAREAEALPRLAGLTPDAAHWLDNASLPVNLRPPSVPSRYVAIVGEGLEQPIALQIGVNGVQVGVTAPERWQRFLPVAGTTLNCAWEGALFPPPGY